MIDQSTDQMTNQLIFILTVLKHVFVQRKKTQIVCRHARHRGGGGTPLSTNVALNGRKSRRGGAGFWTCPQ